MIYKNIQSDVGMWIYISETVSREWERQGEFRNSRIVIRRNEYLWVILQEFVNIEFVWYNWNTYRRLQLPPARWQNCKISFVLEGFFKVAWI